jgi:hypothetical protein
LNGSHLPLRTPPLQSSFSPVEENAQWAHRRLDHVCDNVTYLLEPFPLLQPIHCGRHGSGRTCTLRIRRSRQRPRRRKAAEARRPSTSLGAVSLSNRGGRRKRAFGTGSNHYVANPPKPPNWRRRRAFGTGSNHYVANPPKPPNWRRRRKMQTHQECPPWRTECPPRWTTPLECALTNSSLVGSIECPFTGSLDLKPPGIRASRPFGGAEVLWRSSTPVTRLEYALTENGFVSSLDCALANSLHLKPRGMNTYKKRGVGVGCLRLGRGKALQTLRGARPGARVGRSRL